MDLELRNKIISYSCGIMFALGWWFFIDGVVVANVQLDASSQITFLYSLPGIVATIALIMMNSISQPIFSEEEQLFDTRTASCTRLFMFVSLLFLFGAFIGSIAIYFIVYNHLPGSGTTPTFSQQAFEFATQAATYSASKARYPGISIIVQNLLLCMSALVFKFGRVNLDDY